MGAASCQRGPQTLTAQPWPSAHHWGLTAPPGVTASLKHCLHSILLIAEVTAPPLLLFHRKGIGVGGMGVEGPLLRAEAETCRSWACVMVLTLAGHCTQCSGGDTSHGSPMTLPGTIVVKERSVTAWDSWTVSLTSGSRHRSPHLGRDDSLWPLLEAQLLCISLKLFQLPPPTLAQSLAQSLDWGRPPGKGHGPSGSAARFGLATRAKVCSSFLQPRPEAGRWKVSYLWELLARSQAQLDGTVWAADIPKECWGRQDHQQGEEEVEECKEHSARRCSIRDWGGASLQPHGL